MKAERLIKATFEEKMSLVGRDDMHGPLLECIERIALELKSFGHRYMRADSLVYGANPVISAVLMVSAAKAGRKVALLPSRTGDDWNYGVLNNPEFRHTLSETVGMKQDTECEDVKSWITGFFAHACRNSSTTLHVKGNLAATLGNKSAGGKAVVYLSSAPPSDLAKQRSELQVFCHMAFRKGLASQEEVLFPKQGGDSFRVVLCDDIVLTSMIDGFSSSDISEDADGNMFFRESAANRVTRFGTGDMLPYTVGDSIKQAVDDVIRASRLYT